MNKIEALFFHADYKQRASGEGGAAWRIRWEREQLALWLPRQARWLEINAVPLEQRQSAPVYVEHVVAFRKALDDLKRAHTRLAKLYDQVRVSQRTLTAVFTLTTP